VFKSPPPLPRYFVLQSIAISVFIISLVCAGAGPYTEPRTTADYLFISDVSRSMLARNYCSEPTLLDRSKQVMHRIVSGVPEGRYGIMAFARLAFPITHMTYDHAYLHDAIEKGLYVGLIFEATATGIANALSEAATKKQELAGIYGNIKHVILLSDGHMEGDWRVELESPLAALRQTGVKVLAVGIGNPGETPIPRMEGEKCIDELLEADRRPLRFPLGDDLLNFIATETQGRYFGEGGTDDLVRYLRQETLEELPEQAEFDAAQQRDISAVFLLTAAIALLGFLLL